MPDPHAEAAAPVAYVLELKETAAGSGYFACVPEQTRVFSEQLDYLRGHPNDEFMHKHLLDVLRVLPAGRIERFIETADPDDAVFLALLHEACIIHGKFHHLMDRFSGTDPRDLAPASPLVYIRAENRPHADLHRTWLGIFQANMADHRPLPPPDQAPPMLYPPEVLRAARRPRSALEPAAGSGAPAPSGDPTSRPGAGETAASALSRLEELGIVSGREMRHTASLAPLALLREWRMALSVDLGRHRLTLSGTQTAYGRGFDVLTARAAYAMEMAERGSAFASVGPSGIRHRQEDAPLPRSDYESLRASGRNVLDPNDLSLEVPYDNDPLHWISGSLRTERKSVPVLVPAQCVFLFCNLDEPALFSAPGSTGLASGNTPAEAKVAALLECLERDAEATTPYHPGGCFTAAAEDPRVAALLRDYAEKGIHVGFQDLTGPFGVPVYKAFVVGPDGTVAKGTGAALDGRRALLSALTETPYPYPSGPPSAPLPEAFAVRRFEDLPSHATGSPETDLSLLESLLLRDDYTPIYVDLTRRDLAVPVVRAIVPGLLPAADFDRFSRVSPRLFANYAALFP